RPCRPTHGTPTWSGPRRSPVLVTAPAEQQPGSHLPPARRHGGLTEPHRSPDEGTTSVHSYLLEGIARLREEDLRRAAGQYGPAGRRGRRPVTAARTVHPEGELKRSKPVILVVLLLPAFRRA